MKKYTVLTVNPGSTGTKVGLVRGDTVIFDLNVENAPGEFDGCKTFAEQAPLREKKIYECLAQQGIDLSTIDAVSGRGVGLQSCIGGTYRLNDLALRHALNNEFNIPHPAVNGIILARSIADKLGKPAFTVNPFSLDELKDVARMTGLKGVYREPVGHPLNMKEVAIRHSKAQGKKYGDCNYVVMHLGGGCSIAAHEKGRIIDQTRVGSGEGPISPNRTGNFCLYDVRALLRQGMTFEDIVKRCNHRGGLMDLTGTDDLRVIRRDIIPAGGKAAQMAQMAVDAMEYSMVKWAAQMAAAMRGKVDAILVTGGLAYDKELTAALTADLDWIAPLYFYPGSFETEALASGAIRVLSGEEEALEYTGQPVWDGFDFAE